MGGVKSKIQDAKWGEIMIKAKSKKKSNIYYGDSPNYRLSIKARSCYGNNQGLFDYE